MTAAPQVTVLSCDPSTAAERALCNFAQFLGLQTELILLEGALTGPPQALLRTAPGGRILALGQPTLSKVFQQSWFEKLLDDTRFIFVYGFAPADRDSPEIRWLTGDAITSVSCMEEGLRKHFAIHADVAYNDFPVSGRSYSLESGSAAVFSSATSESGFESYITINGHPHFISVARAHSIVFMLAGAELVDIDTSLTPTSSIRCWYAQLIAMSIVLRAAAGQWCWNSPVTAANFMVDDLYLKRRYGFVHYETLMRELVKARGALTVAFIPFNYQRSSRQTVELLRRHSERFSIAVHGCDHTDGEYAGNDEGWLTGLTHCARERMEAHARINQLPFDNVMVFPKGEFSTKGVGALAPCGFDAAVNTTQWPLDAGENRLTIRDLLQIAVTRYEGFPIYGRRYPDDTFDFAFDALFQKPILAVVHHGFFRNGYESFAGVIRDLSGIKTNLVWMPLGQAVASSCLLRRAGDGRYAVRHFANVLQLKNSTSNDWDLAFEKPAANGSIKAVVIDGTEVPFEIISGQLKYEGHLPAGQQLDLQIIHYPKLRLAWTPSLRYRLGTSLRRGLSDIRDNQLARSERLVAIAQKIKGRLATPRRPKK